MFIKGINLEKFRLIIKASRTTCHSKKNSLQYRKKNIFIGLTEITENPESDSEPGGGTAGR